MCGIAGILEYQGISPSREILQAMGDRMHHRGPDGEGIHLAGPCGLVHRRLAILDPQMGVQPLSNEDGTVWITYNGEIYNSPDLRRYLRGKGHIFRTMTDTEVIVHLYEEDPEGFVDRFEGIFAFGLWDSRSQRLIIARDYIGVKPLYYYAGPRCFLFASEVKALFVDSRVPCQPDEKGLIEILAFQNTYPGRTCFKNIRLLDGGEIQTIEREGRCSARKYWSFEAELPTRENPQEAAVELRALLEKVIHEQLMSDVPVATYLSGGMDTGTITAVAGRHLPELMTFSGGFLMDGAPEYLRNYDEREAAAKMSHEFGTQHHFREIKPDDLLECFAAIAWHLEEPRGSTCYAPWVMAHEAGKRVKVILSGHGGDELFAGYRAKYQLAQEGGRNWENLWFSSLNYLMRQDEALSWLNNDFATPDLLAWPRAVYDEFIYQSRNLTPMGRAQHHDLFVYMHGLLLIEDKLSMAHSLESRVPFLDRRIFRFAWSLPDEWKLNRRFGKVILRKALQGLLPSEILARDKIGFGPPDNYYFRTWLRPFLEGILFADGFAKRGIIKPEIVRSHFERQMEGEDLQQHLWTFASIEMWYRTFFDRQSILRVSAKELQPAPIQINFLNNSTAGVAPQASQTVPVPRRSSMRVWLRKVAWSRHWQKLVHRGRGKMRRAIIRLKNSSPSRRKLLRAFSSLIWLSTMLDYLFTSWRLVNGSYAVQMRAKLERQLPAIPPPRSDDPMRIFHGLYHAPQPVFYNRAFKSRGLFSTYETLDQNPGFPKVDVYYPMHHPDTYREHAVIERNILKRINPPVANAANLAELEKFFSERWPQYDVFHFNWFISFLPDNVDVEYLRRSGRPVYFHFRGCFILTKIVMDFTVRGQSVAEACQYCQQMGWRDEYFSRFFRAVRFASRVFSSTPNLCHCSPMFEYLPNSLEPAMESTEPKSERDFRPGPIVVMHAPFNEDVRDYKGTPFVIAAVEALKKEGWNVELRLVQKVSRAEAVKLYGKADIFVEQLHLGSYGNAGIEAMAYGLPVISSHHPAHAHLAPGCPIIHADPTTLTDRLRELLREPSKRVEIGRRTYGWVRTFHSNERISTHLLRIYREDLGWQASRPRNVLRNENPQYGE